VRRLNLPILAMIGYQPKLTEGPITQLQPRSVQAEAYRSLRTNLNYGNPDKPIKTILITSPSPANGKTTISANLAVISAQGGKKVTLIDADLHRPRAQEVFNTDNERGVSDILLNVDITFQDVMKQTKTNDLSLITSGPLIPNPSEILGTRKMRNLLQELESVNDLLVIDSPPVLSVSDALVLASHVDAVLVVVKPSEINIRGVQHTIEQIRRVGGNVIGIVLNEVKSTHTRYNSYYPGYQTYGKGYAAAYGEEKKNGYNGKKEKSSLSWTRKK
jgi:capsular exopolysaccharide synthesis family protein